MAVKGAVILPHPPVILPEVGRGREREIQKTQDAYKEAAGRVAEWNPETLIVTTPHSVMYADYFHISPGEKAAGDLKNFGVSGWQQTVEYDSEFSSALADLAWTEGVSAGTLGEQDPALDHGTLIPLRFLTDAGVSAKVVRIGLSGLSPLTHYRLGKCIAQTAENLNRSIVVVASGDLSHKLLEEGPYGFAPEGPDFDAQVREAMEAGDFMRFLTFDEAFCEKAAECGLRSFQIMAGALSGLQVKPELLSYEGTFGVGYGVAVFTPLGRDDARCFDRLYEERERVWLEDIKEREDDYVKLARLSLETYVRTGKRADLPQGLPEELLRQRAGVFVSLKKEGRLRGCIGTTGPSTGCVGEEILRNAVSAGCQDPRFDPVTEEELDQLVYSVDVLGTPEPAGGLEDLDPARYGVIVTSGGKRGLLLPNLEGVDTAEEQVEIARKKAGIPPGKRCGLERFEVVRHR